jgi:GNAT superfamily N-acetyltransferase
VLSGIGPAAALLGRAFADDPLLAWVIPDEQVRRQRLPGLFAAQLGIAHLGGFETDVMCAGDPILGCAVWSPPGASPSVLQQLVALATIPLIPMSRLAVALSTFHEINRERPKGPPHWYLSLLGVDPPAQRTGVARGLLTPRLARCDEARAPSALTSGEANVAYYEAFGYTATRKIEVSGNGPTHWVMWRNPGELANRRPGAGH